MSPHAPSFVLCRSLLISHSIVITTTGSIKECISDGAIWNKPSDSHLIIIRLQLLKNLNWTWTISSRACSNAALYPINWTPNIVEYRMMLSDNRHAFLNFIRSLETDRSTRIFLDYLMTNLLANSTYFATGHIVKPKINSSIINDARVILHINARPRQFASFVWACLGVG